MSSTNQTQTSKDKGIIQGIGYKEFSAICDEYNIVEKATKELLEIASNPMTNERVQVDIYKWIIEMKIGKAKQMNEIVMDAKDDEHSSLVISYTTSRNDLEALEKLEKKLLKMGVTEQEIEEAKKTGYTTDDEARDDFHQQNDTENLGGGSLFI